MNTRETQVEKVKKHLKKGKSITNADAVRLFNAYRLSSIIYSLRYTHGMNIKMEVVEKNGERFGRYYL